MKCWYASPHRQTKYDVKRNAWGYLWSLLQQPLIKIFIKRNNLFRVYLESLRRSLIAVFVLFKISGNFTDMADTCLDWTGYCLEVISEVIKFRTIELLKISKILSMKNKTIWEVLDSARLLLLNPQNITLSRTKVPTLSAFIFEIHVNFSFEKSETTKNRCPKKILICTSFHPHAHFTKFVCSCQSLRIINYPVCLFKNSISLSDSLEELIFLMHCWFPYRF